MKRNIRWQDVLFGYYSDSVLINNFYNEVIFTFKHNIYKANNKAKREGRIFNKQEMKWKTLQDLRLLKNVILIKKERMQHLSVLEKIIEEIEKW